jgi:hypothetical protein
MAAGVRKAPRHEIAGSGAPERCPGKQLVLAEHGRGNTRDREPMRELIEDLWPELVHKLPLKRRSIAETLLKCSITKARCPILHRAMSSSGTPVRWG